MCVCVSMRVHVCAYLHVFVAGLSEACFRRAESCMEKNFDLTAVHCVGEVLSALAR